MVHRLSSEAAVIKIKVRDGAVHSACVLARIVHELA